MRNSKKIMGAAVCGALFLLLILLVKLVDVAEIGPEGTAVGLSHLNEAVHKMTGVHMAWYKITEAFGILAILTAAFFAFLGLLQLIKRKSLLKVDRQILTLGGLYAVVIVLYVIFEKIIVNYRPVIMPGDEHVEASFPSSHTMLICVVMGSAVIMFDLYVQNTKIRSALKIACIVILIATVLGRLISGIHWFTDILGGLLISAALLLLFTEILDRMKPKKKSRKRARR